VRMMDRSEDREHAHTAAEGGAHKGQGTGQHLECKQPQTGFQVRSSDAKRTVIPAWCFLRWPMTSCQAGRRLTPVEELLEADELGLLTAWVRPHLRPTHKGHALT
jgi:hypothetical protein